MIRVTAEDEKFIRENLDDADKLLASDDVNDVLCALFIWMEIKGLDKDEMPNERGRRAQKVYDSLYELND